jgi:hypothetical protein
MSFSMLPLAFLLASMNANAMTNQVTKVAVLGKTPSQIYDFMFGLDKEKYIAWHLEHKDFKIIKQTTDTVGSVFFFHEQMDKLKVKYRWEVLEIVKNYKIVMKAQYFIPIYLILTLDETPNGTLVTHDLQIGYKQKTTGLIDWCIRNFVFTKSKRHSQDRHAIEEFKNLERLL